MLSLFLHNPRLGNIQLLQCHIEFSPVETASLASTPVKPFEGTPYGV
jgi:hypothetical protein